MVFVSGTWLIIWESCYVRIVVCDVVTPHYNKYILERC